jgi:hypothetical protein
MEARLNNLTYAICNIATDLQNAGTIRRSLDDTLFVIKYNAIPTFIYDGSVTPSQILSHEECLQLMSTPDWSGPITEE